MATEYHYDPLKDAPVAPGEIIREILDERGITQVDFASRMARSQKFISELINGKASLTYETALDLERVLGVPASFWNNGESIYRTVLARQQREEESAELVRWAKTFPTKAMIDQGLIAKEDSPAEQAESLLEYFGVSSVAAYREHWESPRRLAARMNTSYSPEQSAITAWLRAGERAAEKVPTEPYSERRFKQVLGELRLATRLKPDCWLPLLKERSMWAGVAVVFVPDLPKTRLHAISWWPTKTKAAIQLGLRGKSDDQVWFSFFHEAAHLLLDARSRSRISDLNRDPVTEQRMDEWASDFLIPPSAYADFCRSKPTRASVESFAQDLGIAASIVVGRLQHDDVIPYSHMQDMKAKLDWAR